MSKINYDKFIKYLVEHSASDEFKNALYAQGLYFDNDELKSIEYRPKFKIGDRITDGRWIYTVKDMDLFNNLYSLENDNGYKTNMVFSYIDKEYKLANIGTSIELTESEDEKIRKDLIEWFEEFPDKIWRGHYKKDVISWLEKQGESYTKRDVDDAWLKGMCDAKQELEKQGEMDIESYKAAEDEKREFVGDGFIKCYADFQDFKEGETYWLEYVSNDNYNVRSDNLLGKTYHITPCQLYTVFKKMTWLEKQEYEQKVNYTTLVETGNGGINALVTRELPTNGCYEQKLAWSEEDEKMLVDAYVMLDWYKGNNWWTARRIKDWLKALKQRIGG